METKSEEDLKLDSDSAQGKKCYICSKSFNFRKKHICKVCSNSVCTDHCQKARVLQQYEDPSPICDLCNQDFIKKEMQAEILSEIQSLEEELANAKAMNNRLEREHFEKTAVINKLELEIGQTTSDHESLVAELNREISGEETRYAEIKEKFEISRLRHLGISEEQASVAEDLFKAQEELEGIKRQSEIIKDTKNDLNQQIDKINAKLKGSLSIDKVTRLLCVNCAGKLELASKSRIETNSILEDASVSMSANDERESVLQSVREYKEILANQNSRPTESNGCVII